MQYKCLLSECQTRLPTQLSQFQSYVCWQAVIAVWAKSIDANQETATQSQYAEE